jgi:hypothetical protein
VACGVGVAALILPLVKEYQWKKDLNKVKNDRTKDIHPSILQMNMNAFSSENDRAGKLCKDFISLYNSKTHDGGLDIKLRQFLRTMDMLKLFFRRGDWVSFCVDHSLTFSCSLGIFSTCRRVVPSFYIILSWLARNHKKSWMSLF